MSICIVFYHRKQHFKNIDYALRKSFNKVLVVTSKRNGVVLSGLLDEQFQSKQSIINEYDDNWFDHVEFIITDEGKGLLNKIYRIKMEEEIRTMELSSMSIDVTNATPIEMMEVFKLSAIIDVSIFSLKNGSEEMIDSFPRLLLLEELEATILRDMYYGSDNHRFIVKDVESKSSIGSSKAYRVVNSLKEKGCFEIIEHPGDRCPGRIETIYEVMDDSLFMGHIRLRMVDRLSDCNKRVPIKMPDHPSNDE